MPRKFHVRKGDIVEVIAGDYKGKRGRVLKVIPKKQKVIVEGVNIVYKHKKPTSQDQESNIVEVEAPIHISNVLPVCPETDQPTRVGRRRDPKTGKLVRYSKRSPNKVEIKY